MHEILQQCFFHHVLVKEKAFCVEAYFTNNSYKVVQASFGKKFQCCHAPSQSIIFDWVQKFREYGSVHYLYSKGLRNTCSGWMVNAKMQRNIDAVHDLVIQPLMTWRPFGKNMTFM